jgi:hypothetical protein
MLRKWKRNLTEREASDEYGMSVHWYRRKRWSGGGPVYIKVSDGPGGKVLYPEESLDRYFASRTRNSTSDTGKAGA